MINRFFAIIGPRRHDLSGLPLGFLFMWRPLDYPIRFHPEIKSDDITIPAHETRDAPGRFAPIRCRWRVGFYLPQFSSRKIQHFESCTLGCAQDMAKRVLQAAVDRKMAELPHGSRIVRDRLLTGHRHDLSENPVQFTRMISVAN